MLAASTNAVDIASQLSDPNFSAKHSMETLKESIKKARLTLSREEINIRNSIDTVENDLNRTIGNASFDLNRTAEIIGGSNQRFN